jgi:glutamate synthase domain-containing protein 3
LIMTTTFYNKPKTGMEIDAKKLSTRDLNAKIREAVAGGAGKITLRNVCGQRYIGTDLAKKVEIDIYGTPGNDLGAFLNGPKITVRGNAQDGVGNTMDSGEIVVNGHAGDIVGLSARGGQIFIREYVGYRAGIHMKEFGGKKPSIVIGGTAQDFLGEYMAGGTIVVLGLDIAEGDLHDANYIGTGMHGGSIFIRGSVNDYQLGKEVGIGELTDEDNFELTRLVRQFCSHFNCHAESILKHDFIKLYPLYLRPYGRLYAY